MTTIYNMTFQDAEEARLMAENLVLHLIDDRRSIDEDDYQIAYNALARFYREIKGATLPDITNRRDKYGRTYNLIEDAPDEAYDWLYERYQEEINYLRTFYQ